MHEAIMGVAKLVEELEQAKRELASHKKDAQMAQTEALNELKKEMAKALTESDIKREVAIARLEAYERSVNKDDFNKEVREMLKLAITGLSSTKSAPQQQKGGGQEQKSQ